MTNYFQLLEKLQHIKHDVQWAGANLIDEQIARAMQFVKSEDGTKEIIQNLVDNKAYEKFQPSEWFNSTNQHQGSNLSVDEIASLAERFKILEWVESGFLETKDQNFWRLGEKLYSGNDTSVIARIDKGVDFIFRPVFNYIDIEIRNKLGYYGEEPMRQTGWPQANELPVADKSKVFVVHGRDLVIRDAMFTFLRSLDLRPIEWEQARKLTEKPNPYIGEILGAAFSNAQAIVVLFTPEDVAQLHPSLHRPYDKENEITPTLQARANVLFEAGMAMGRDENRTVLVQLGEIRPFSDIAGRHMLIFDSSVSQRKELAQRLEAAGCPVNTTGTSWLTAGEFIFTNRVPTMD